MARIYGFVGEFSQHILQNAPVLLWKNGFQSGVVVR